MKITEVAQWMLLKEILLKHTSPSFVCFLSRLQSSEYQAGSPHNG